MIKKLKVLKKVKFFKRRKLKEGSTISVDAAIYFTWFGIGILVGRYLF